MNARTPLLLLMLACGLVSGGGLSLAYYDALHHCLTNGVQDPFETSPNCPDVVPDENVHADCEANKFVEGRGPLFCEEGRGILAAATPTSFPGLTSTTNPDSIAPSWAISSTDTPLRPTPVPTPVYDCEPPVRLKVGETYSPEKAKGIEFQLADAGIRSATFKVTKDGKTACPAYSAGCTYSIGERNMANAGLEITTRVSTRLEQINDETVLMSFCARMS